MKKLALIFIFITSILRAQDTVPVIDNGSPVIDTYGKIVYYIESAVIGVVNFDNTASIELDSKINVSGTKTITLEWAVIDQDYVNGNFVSFTNSTSDMLTIYISKSTGTYPLFTVAVDNVTPVSNRYQLTASDYNVSGLNTLEIIKGTGSITSFKINGNTITPTSLGISTYIPTSDYIGLGIETLDGATLWNINVNDEHQWLGQPAGNTDAAWIDNIGSVNCTVNGSPTTINLP